MTSARDVLAGRRCVLLDFDGPVCAVFGGSGPRAIGEQLATFLDTIGVRVPEALAGTSDPFALLRLAATINADVARKTDTQFRRLETAAVKTATETDGTAETLRSLTDEGRSVAIVSNNSAQAIRAYLDGHDLSRFVSHVAGRTGPDVTLLKPNPHLLHAAMQAVGASPIQSVMVGDSPSDMEAARRAGAAAIGFANRPHKRVRLAACHPDAIIERMKDLAVADPTHYSGDSTNNR